MCAILDVNCTADVVAEFDIGTNLSRRPALREIAVPQ